LPASRTACRARPWGLRGKTVLPVRVPDVPHGTDGVRRTRPDGEVPLRPVCLAPHAGVRRAEAVRGRRAPSGSE
jgi:hypothetical protein